LPYIKAHGKRIRVSNDTVVEGDMHKSAKGKRQRKYGDRVLNGLLKIWGINSCILSLTLLLLLLLIALILLLTWDDLLLILKEG